MQFMTTATTALIAAELPSPFDPRWSRLPGVAVDDCTVIISPDDYFFRFNSSCWLVTDWEVVRDELFSATETAEEAIEQAALEFIRSHARVTADPAEVLRIAWQVYSYLFRDELLPVAGLERVGPAELRMLREAATFMALNKVRDNGAIANVGPCWFFPAAAGVVFDLDEEAGQQLDEVYHGTWFNETRRIESIKAHAALGGRLVHGCQSAPNQSGGAVVPYGASIDRFRRDLDAFRDDWLAAVRFCKVS
jgi:hypothetical protein